MFALGNATFACGVCSAREWSFEEASGERKVGRRLLALAPRTRPTHANRSQVEPATSAGVSLHETGQFLLLCSLQLWQQLQRCRQTRARVQVFDAFYFRSMETVHQEAVTSERSR